MSIARKSVKTACRVGMQSAETIARQACMAISGSKLEGDIISFTHDTGEVFCQVKKAIDIAATAREEILDLLEENMKALYIDSSMGWDRREKRFELFAKSSYFILLRHDDLPLTGFLNWRFDCEECHEDDPMARREEDMIEVVYCYELQIASPYRKYHLGEHLMNMLYSIGTESKMRKIMLTVFLSNESARRFYKRLGYISDLISPIREKVGKHITADYDIMSKACELS